MKARHFRRYLFNIELGNYLENILKENLIKKIRIIIDLLALLIVIRALIEVRK